MKFTELLTSVRGLDLEERPSRRPPRDNVRRTQDLLSTWLADEDFYLDCIELELSAIASQEASMFRMRDRPLLFKIFYWWPGRIAVPHEHTQWTVTAVFYNSLQVTTYDWDTAFREQRLERKNVFVAQQGRAGHIYDRCIHNPSNPTNRDSMSMHIFNESDAQLIEHQVGPIAGLGAPSTPLPADPELRAASLARRKERQLRVLAQAAAQFWSDRAASIVKAILACGDPETQARIDQLYWRATRARGVSASRDDARGGADTRD